METYFKLQCNKDIPRLRILEYFVAKIKIANDRYSAVFTPLLLRIYIVGLEQKNEKTRLN